MEHIRQAVPTDASRIADIIVSNYRINFCPFFRDDEYYYKELNVIDMAAGISGDNQALNSTFVYDDGVVKSVVRMDGNEIKQLFVEPNFQDHGIGAELLRFAVSSHNGRSLCVPEYNKRAISFYLRNGFRFTGE